MKNKLFIFSAVILMFASCTTNEERAENLISNYIRDRLTYPESYKSISTRVDSSRINISRMAEIIKVTKECIDLYDKTKWLELQIEYAESTMKYYTPDKYKYNRAKAEKEEYELEALSLNKKLEEKVLTLRTAKDSLYDKEINGWAVTHRFRCKADFGTPMPPQELLFFYDIKFEECQVWTPIELDSFSKIIECINEYESNKVLLNNLEDIQYIYNHLKY